MKALPRVVPSRLYGRQLFQYRNSASIQTMAKYQQKQRRWVCIWHTLTVSPRLEAVRFMFERGLYLSKSHGL